MSERVAHVVTPAAAAYALGPEHPLRLERVSLTWDLIDACGLNDLPNVAVIDAVPATREDLLRVHTEEYLRATEAAGHGEAGDWSRFGFGQGDNPIFPNMHEASSIVSGASIAAAEAVWSGRAEHSFNAAGGLHHAMPARASGFCVYDDPAIAIAWLLAQGAERIAYVDVDVHHGDGPDAIFRHDDRVLTISIHEFGSWFFPGTGGESIGTSVNVPLDAGIDDAGWLAAFRAVVPERVRAFEPQVLFTQLGCDTHVSDPLASLTLSTFAYRETAAELHRLAHEAAGGRWVAVGGGGYQWARVVPRAWTLYFAEMAGVAGDLPDELPSVWVERASELVGGRVPTTFSDA
jgi:acetoin utilization protein AcuC